MKKYTVIYESNGGEIEIFGVFNSFKEAMEWAKEDVAQMYEGALEDVIEDSNSYELLDFGIWEVKPINMVN